MEAISGFDEPRRPACSRRDQVVCELRPCGLERGGPPFECTVLLIQESDIDAQLFEEKLPSILQHAVGGVEEVLDLLTEQPVDAFGDLDCRAVQLDYFLAREFRSVILDGISDERG